jgi:NAD(P)H-hydrate epimerase
MDPRRRLPVLSCAEAAAAEAAHLGDDGRLAWRLMNAAARATAAHARALLPSAPRSTLVIAGKGRNGADAFLTALLLAPRGGRVVRLLVDGEPHERTARRAWRQRKAGVKVVTLGAAEATRAGGKEHDLVIDGLFGQGFRPPLSARHRRVLRWAEGAAPVRVSVDLPSGLGDAGGAAAAFKADLTVSIGCLKRPLLTPGGARAAGRVRVADIGLPLAETEENAALPGVLRPLGRPRAAGSDKRHHGRACIIGGSDGMPGAAIMNVRAAVQSGAALVTAAVPESVRAAAAAGTPEAMWRSFRTARQGAVAAAEAPALARLCADKDAVLAGSGMTCSALTTLRRALSAYRGDLVLDADALRPELVRALRSWSTLTLLPHAGEFLRLTGTRMSPQTGRRWAARLGAVIVLKGPLTAVTDGVRTSFVPFGGPVLARGGSGDLLAGMVVSLLARRRALGLGHFEAVEAAVVWHALAAETLSRNRGEEAVRTTELLSGLSPALRSALR